MIMLRNTILFFCTGWLAVISPAQAGLCSEPHGTDMLTQFAAVDAADGYVNLRDNKKQVIARLNNQSIVYVFEPAEDHWCTVDLPRHGYIHDSGLRAIESFPAVPFLRVSRDLAVFGNARVQVEIRVEPFNKTAHKYRYGSLENGGLLSKIDEADYYGRDGDMPVYQYRSINVTLNGKKLSLPKQALHNLYEPNLPDPSQSSQDAVQTDGVYEDRVNDALYISMLNGDAAGAYHVLWVIRHGRYQGRYIAIPF